jgi:hypothetical protein
MSHEPDGREDPAIATMEADVAAMGRFLTVLRPLTTVQRLRVLAAAAALYGDYDMADVALEGARRLARREET